MKFFPRFFLLYFLVFHIYFFSYAYGFSYLALMTTAAFMQHLILYFWNRFEVPALQRFLQSRQSHLHQHPDFHITSSTILASTLHITRLNRTTTRNRSPSSPNNTIPNQNTETRTPTANGGVENPTQHQEQEENTANTIPAEANPQAGAMSSFSSMLLWILGGASSEGLNSFLSMFRDVVRDEHEAQVFADTTTSPQNPHHAPLLVD